MLDTAHLLSPSDFPALRRGPLETLQVNLGFRCNLSCQHCHVNAGPNRDEMMDADIAAQVLDFMRRTPLRALDLTGGAPELNPHFRELVVAAGSLGLRLIDRCNLTILEEPGQEGLAEFLAAQGVEVVASLPCYLQENVDGQRGKGTYAASIRGLQRLNALGYGRPGSGLLLNLVYNPTGPYLPPPQCALEADYRRRLLDDHGVHFNQLLTITNMPIQRFGSVLQSRGEFGTYMQLLKDAYREDNLAAVMCRSLISVDWQGRVYDCDFNQMLNLPMRDGAGRPLSLDRLQADSLADRAVCVADHCYGCTAGQGSSCGGALSE